MYSDLNPNAVVVKYLVDLFRSNPLVNDIKFGAKSLREIDKAQLFPLVHIIPLKFNLTANRIEFPFEIACVSLRNIEPALMDNFFEDNFIDNLNQSSAILIKAFNTLLFQDNKYDILIDENISGDVIDFLGTTLLDGYVAKIVLSIQNEIGIC